ncbi:hypothetical protein IJI91_00850 [Candidatus Saccharibacteria bacterium]|nr:hypothetical protein [Candidatus Saccharibacteria bacterium]
MVFDIHEVEGVSDFVEKKQGEDILYMVGERAFLVVHKNTIEVRTDEKLRGVLCEKYESVMESRYFGKGGIEIVMSGQLALSEVRDLVRLSYNLTKVE